MAVQNKQIAKHRQAMIVVLFACNLLASLMQSLMNVALDYVSAEYHVSLSEANLLVLGYSIVAGIVIVLAALSLHRFGLRKVMLFGLIVSFVGSMLGVVAWDFPSLVAARLIQAVATGLYFPVVNEALLNLSPKLECICIKLGFTKNLVLPLPLPPITRIFLFLAYFGCFGRLFMVSRSVCVRSTLF